MAKQYKVGYGKPPEEHKWKPGQSGNPSGKKLKAGKAANAKSLRDYLVEELLEPVSLTVGVKTQEVPLVWALAKALLRDLLSASPKDKILLLKEIKHLGVLDGLETRLIDAQADAESGGLVTEEERMMLKALNEALADEDD